MEDLWAFNEEIVARAIFQSEIPVISAVGHEVDYTIADFTADFRAATPSAAAELVMPRKTDLEEDVKMLMGRLTAALRSRVESLEKTLQGLANRYVLKDPVKMFVQKAQEVDEMLRSLDSRIRRIVENALMDLAVLFGKMKVLNPLGVLERGYSITFQGGKILTDASSLKEGDIITAKLAKGTMEASVKKVITG